MIRAVGRSFGPIREGRRSRPPRVSQLWVKYLVSTRHHWVDIFIVRRQGPDGGRVPRTQRPRVRPEEGWALPGCTLPKTHHAMTTHNHSIPDRSLPGSIRTAPSTVHQDEGVKCATGASSKIRGRDNITIGTWNTRTCRETSGTNTRNGQAQMEHPWTL